VSLDPKDFEGKAVLILGKGIELKVVHLQFICNWVLGNSAFETASNIVGSTSHIHMISR